MDFLLQEFFKKERWETAIDVGVGKKIENIPGVVENFAAGDQVSHIKFGKGTVEAVKNEGSDAFVTIAFDNGETKQLSTKFAKLKKL